MVLFIQEFNIDLVHRKGKKHTNADFCSRYPCCDDEHMNSLEYYLNRFTLSSSSLNRGGCTLPTVKELIDEQASDLELQAMISKNKLNAHFTTEDGLVKHFGNIYVPMNLRENILEHFHGFEIMRHLGSHKT